jgi:hypothetical protein
MAYVSKRSDANVRFRRRLMGRAMTGLVKVFGRRPSKVAVWAWAGVRKPPKHEPAGTGARLWVSRGWTLVFSSN